MEIKCVDSSDYIEYSTQGSTGKIGPKEAKKAKRIQSEKIHNTVYW